MIQRLISNEYTIEQKQKHPNNQFSGVEQVTQYYINSLKNKLNDKHIVGAYIGIAALVAADNVRLTNFNWSFSIKEIQLKLKLENLIIINGFAAYAYTTPFSLSLK